MANGEDDARLEAERQASLDLILASRSDRRVIVAGPGCGKTYTFKKLLEASPGPNLVLTFINNLVADLKGDLGDLGEVSTFHAFCRRLLHTTSVEGVSYGVDYFPQLPQLIVEDIFLVDERHLRPLQDLDGALHNLDDSKGVITSILRSGDYYDSVSHNDAVYRVLRVLESAPETIPRFGLVVVDEYQDFSLLEVRLIHALAQVSPVVVAGDDDQALYSFKHASAQYLRDVVMDDSWETLELPYCSRCPEVVVEATQRVVSAATDLGLLEGRVEKRFECYLPEKRSVSQQYPKIVHARCTVQRNNAPYMSRFIEACITAITYEDVVLSREATNPTVLITGPNPFAGQIYAYLKTRLANVTLKASEAPEVSLLDGYLRLMKHESSRLGWRIVLAMDPLDDLPQFLTRSLVDGEELDGLLPESFKSKHLAQVATLRKIKNGEPTEDAEINMLVEGLGMVLDLIRIELGLEESTQAMSSEILGLEDDVDAPSILITSLPGAKGLQAEHVFVVGVSAGHFPRSWPPSDEEVCCFLVALTRAKQSCTIVTCDRLGQQSLSPAQVIDWLGDLVEGQRVDRTFF